MQWINEFFPLANEFQKQILYKKRLQEMAKSEEIYRLQKERDEIGDCNKPRWQEIDRRLFELYLQGF